MNKNITIINDEKFAKKLAVEYQIGWRAVRIDKFNPNKVVFIYDRTPILDQLILNEKKNCGNQKLQENKNEIFRYNFNKYK